MQFPSFNDHIDEQKMEINKKFDKVSRIEMIMFILAYSNDYRYRI